MSNTLFIPMHIMTWESLTGPDDLKLQPHPSMGFAFIPVFKDLQSLEEHFPHAQAVPIRPEDVLAD